MRENYLVNQRGSMKTEMTSTRNAGREVAQTGLMRSRKASLDPTCAGKDLIIPTRKFTSSIAAPVSKIIHSSNKSAMRK